MLFFFQKGGFFILELLSFLFSPFFATRSETREKCCCFLFRRIVFLGDILSFSLYTVYFVLHCFDLRGVLMYLFIWFQLCRIYKETKLQNTRSLCFYCRICNTVLFHFISVTQLVERKQKPEFVRQTSINRTADGKQSTNSFRCLSSACLFLTLPRR